MSIVLRPSRRSAVLGALLAVSTLAGCNAYNDVTGSINPAAPRLVTEDVARGRLDQYAQLFAEHPNDKVAAIDYAMALRANGRYAQAVAILENVAIKNPNDPEVLGEYGKALADVGRLQEAAQVLANAQDPSKPSWSILSAQGVVQDELGNHAKAQEYYKTALQISPGRPTVLSNLGLSYALSRNLGQAESVLRQAAAEPGADARVRQNLALVLSLEGKSTEAEKIDEKDMSPQQAQADVATIEKMVAQSDTWRQIQQADSRARARALASDGLQND